MITVESFPVPALEHSLRQNPWAKSSNLNAAQDISWADYGTQGISSLNPWGYPEFSCTQDLAQADIGWNHPIWPTGIPVSIGNGQGEASLATEASLEELRLLLANCLKNDTLSAGAEKIDLMAPRLEPITIDRDRGELVRNVKKLYSSLPSEALIRLFGYCVFLSSNNLVSDHETDKILRRIAQNDHGWILITLFQSKTVTVEIFASNLLLSAARLQDIGMVQILIECGAEINAPGGRVSRSTALQEAVKTRNIRLVEILLRAGCGS
jgi:hypothetical protein